MAAKKIKVTLRKVTETDGPFIVRWRNANREFFPEQEPFTNFRHMKWYWDTYRSDPADHYYTVRADGLGVGTISFNSKTLEIGRVMLGDKDFARKGVMSAALRQVKANFTVGRYWLEVLAANSGAIAFYERNGFYATKATGDMIRMEST